MAPSKQDPPSSEDVRRASVALLKSVGTQFSREVHRNLGATTKDEIIAAISQAASDGDGDRPPYTYATTVSISNARPDQVAAANALSKAGYLGRDDNVGEEIRTGVGSTELWATDKGVIAGVELAHGADLRVVLPGVAFGAYDPAPADLSLPA